MCNLKLGFTCCWWDYSAAPPVAGFSTQDGSVLTNTVRAKEEWCSNVSYNFYKSLQSGFSKSGIVQK
jgi:hypothetical protein